ncbi:unnamed protein product [Polarella glacialis]|uniref:Uncharacterized protein n=1 Tax=Polarella glacialis TaxID=89957 RepID=A0A813I8L1_POLGL|nr:unnamed protein product [Polarella glacialis]
MAFRPLLSPEEGSRPLSASDRGRGMARSWLLRVGCFMFAALLKAGPVASTSLASSGLPEDTSGPTSSRTPGAKAGQQQQAKTNLEISPGVAVRFEPASLVLTGRTCVPHWEQVLVFLGEGQQTQQPLSVESVSSDIDAFHPSLVKADQLLEAARQGRSNGTTGLAFCVGCCCCCSCSFNSCFHLCR